MILAALLLACTPAPPAAPIPGGSYVNDDVPPVRFQGDATVTVTFGSTAKMNEICAPSPRPCGTTYFACTTDHHISMPNPCLPKFKGELYAKTMCHELGHANHWPAYHGP